MTLLKLIRAGLGIAAGVIIAILAPAAAFAVAADLAGDREGFAAAALVVLVFAGSVSLAVRWVSARRRDREHAEEVVRQAVRAARQPRDGGAR